MSTGKHFSALCALVLALALAVTVLFMNGEKLGIRVIRDEDSETHEDSGYFTSNDQNTAWTAATTITLSGDTATVSGSGAYTQTAAASPSPLPGTTMSPAPSPTAASSWTPGRTPRCSSA